MPRIRLLVLAALVLLAWSPAAHAFRFEPISRVFEPSGSRATQSFIIHNTSSERIAVEVSIGTLERNVDYKESSRPADEDFLVYPSQVIVGPGSRQTIRVKWLGDPDPASERAYRIIAEQLPIELTDPSGRPSPTAQGKLRVLLTYRGSLYVRPRGAKPVISVQAATLAKGTNGDKRLSVILRNRGTAHGLISSCRGTLRSRTSGQGIRLRLDPAVSDTKILAGGQRRYLLPWPKSMAPGPVDARIRCALAR